MACFTAAKWTHGALAKVDVGIRSRRIAARAAADDKSDRTLWYPGAKPPAYLDGSMAGDFGFDPLRFGANSSLLPYYKEAELMNGRWAMFANVGILFTEAIGKGPWWEAGKMDTVLSLPILVAVQVATLGFLEYFRIEGWQRTGKIGVLKFYPWDPLDYFGPFREAEEVYNARAAMIGFVGFASQAAVRGMGPIESVKFHLADPKHNNIFTSSVGDEFLVAVIALTTAPVFIQAYKNFGSDNEEEFNPIPW